MTIEQVWLAATGAVALVALLLAARAQRRTTRAEALAALLAERVALLEAPAALAAPFTVPDSAYVITGIDAQHAAAPATVPVAQPIDGRLFADIVAREAVVTAASWTHGLRRALSAENRNRIRFQVRQETRRAGRDRRAETKQALREYRARARAAADHRVDSSLDSSLDSREDVA